MVSLSSPSFVLIQYFFESHNSPIGFLALSLHILSFTDCSRDEVHILMCPSLHRIGIGFLQVKYNRVPLYSLCHLYRIHVISSTLCMKEVKGKVAQSCPTLCDPMDCTVRGILQARILE